MRKNIVLSFLMMIAAFALNAKTYSFTIKSDPDGAQVYLNGQLVAETTPAIIEVDSKIAEKPMMFKFEKEGYKTKNITVTYDKKQLKKYPVVYATLTKDPGSYTKDPTVTQAMSNQRVTRENAGQTDMENTIIRWFFDSDPRGARIYYRVISSVPNEVKNTNEAYLTTTPLEETKSFNILGLTYDNSRDVTIEIKVSKKGYEDQVKRFNVRQALDQQEISGFFELVRKETGGPGDY